MTLARLFIGLPVVVGLYAYVGYPLLLMLLSGLRRDGYVVPVAVAGRQDWPAITITIPSFNEEASIAATLDHVLEVDYPADKRRIIVVSDASTDRTDEIVRSYAAYGVELLRLPVRLGKSGAENAAARLVTTDIIVNTDASVWVLPHAVKPLVAAFDDPTVGVASGRDVSAGDAAREGNRSESGYVGYEMAIRDLETRLGSIVGASGSFYGFRRAVYDPDFPEALSRDFASVLIARERGFRGVSVVDAPCVVPRTQSLKGEQRRKTRTMARGLATLWYKRHLMYPWRYGFFAFMLASHKLCRWLLYPALVVSLVTLIVLAPYHTRAAVCLCLAAAAILAGEVGLRWPKGGTPPYVLAVAGYALGSIVAGARAWILFLRGQRFPTWEPTRRPAV